MGNFSNDGIEHSIPNVIKVTRFISAAVLTLCVFLFYSVIFM